VILMPRLSDTMTEGVIAAWHKNIGDTVKKGDLLAEIETDKATMELESYKDGTLLHIGIDKGGKLQVNDVLAIIGKQGEDITTLLNSGSAAVKKEETKKEITVAEITEPVKSPALTDVSNMEEVVLMPRLSDTMEEGVIASWQKKVGDTVKKGDVLAEIETDKATMELESYKNGTLLYIGAEKGEKIPVNGLLCIIGEKNKVDVEAIVAAVKKNDGIQSVISSQQSVAEISKPVAETITTSKQPVETISSDNGRVKASPLAKKIAKEKGVDLKMLHGSGDGGRITKADIDSYKESGTRSQE
jgi:pyruvate dehydrogenase E2 component (dihydrolipoamide acetyltransferase)